jgi:hypothetical protein
MLMGMVERRCNACTREEGGKESAQNDTEQAKKIPKHRSSPIVESRRTTMPFRSCFGKQLEHHNNKRHKGDKEKQQENRERGVVNFATGVSTGKKIQRRGSESEKRRSRVVISGGEHVCENAEHKRNDTAARESCRA